MITEKPKRCVDPVMKFCQECPWGWTSYPEWVETYEDLSWCTIESGCTLGYDQGRPEDEPTEEDLKEFDEWYKMVYGLDKIPDQNDIVPFEDWLASHTGAAPEEESDRS